MNPNLSVNSKRITIINNQADTPQYEFEGLFELIQNYLLLCRKDASLNTKKPKKHHLIPKFLLEDFEGYADGHDNRLKVVKYKITPARNIKIEQVPDITKKGYSVKEDFYSIEEFYQEYEDTRIFGGNDKYRIEKLLSVIEGNAAPFLKLRRQKYFYRSSTYANPYYYPEVFEMELEEYESRKILINSTQKRIALSVFFAMQYLRSYFMYTIFLKDKEKIKQEDHPIYGKFEGENFPDFIEYMLPSISLFFYIRAWRWVYSPFEHFMLSGITVVPLFLEKYTTGIHLGAEDSLIMPLGRKVAIYFLNQETFFTGHDGVFSNNHLGISVWNNIKMAGSIALDMPTESNEKDGSRSATICMHPEANLAHAFKTGDDEDPKMKKLLESLSLSEASNSKMLNFLGSIPRI